jgi:hypothetical protein
MFEKEIKFIVDFSLNKVKTLGSFFSFEKLLATDVHPAILHYISAEIDFLIFEDRKNLIQNSVFDYSGPEIANYFNLIGQEVKKTRRISVDDIKKLITQAVSFNVNYIARPKWSLTKLIFNESEMKPIEEVKLSLSYVFYYDYFKNILLSYLNKKGLVSLSLIEFEVLLNKVDKELFTAQSTKLVDNALYSIADFMNNGNSSNKVPIQSVEVFFKERNLLEYLFKLRRALPIDAKQKYSVDELRAIIYSPTTAEKQPLIDEPAELENLDKDFRIISYDENLSEPEKLKDEDITPPSEIPDEDLLKDLNEPFDFVSDKTTLDDALIDDELIIESSENDNSFDLYDEELKSLEELENEITDDKGEIEFEINDLDNEFTEIDEPSPGFEKDQSIENNTDEKDFLPETPETSGVAREIEPYVRDKNIFPNDLFAYLKDKEIDKIVNSVFDEDREDFAITMDRIAECSTYGEATDILKSVFLTYRVNPFSRDAVTLTGAVANYFNQV